MITKKINLIGISGHSGTGKDTLAHYLNTRYQDVWNEAFAIPLKDACSLAFGIDENTFYLGDKKEVKHPFWGVSPREIAQFVGTELFRDHIWKLIPGLENPEDFWVKRLE